jgi:hypothetical protein
MAGSGSYPMTTALAHCLRQRRSLLTTPQDRHRVLTFAQSLTHGARLTPTPAQQQLLAEFVRGELSFDQLLTSLETQP